MQITFARSGGFPGALRNVKGTVQISKADQAEVTSEPTYRRTLTPAEASQLRSGAEPAELVHAARQIAARTCQVGRFGPFRHHSQDRGWKNPSRKSEHIVGLE